jgi:predicted metalloprotease
MGAWRSRFVLSLFLALLALPAACGGEDSPSDQGATGTVRPTEEAVTDSIEPTDRSADDSGTPDPETQRKVQELLDDSSAATEVVDQFWAAHWLDYFAGSYSSPVVSGGYFGSDNPTCGGIYADGSGNAYFCPAEDYLAWDWELFAANFLDEAIGDSFVYLVVAHEWGHAIQERLDLSLQTIDSELQADCFAGAALTGAEADGTLVFEPGDRGEIFESLTAVADETEWGDSSDHGSADQRIEAYQLGENGGVDACLPAQ